jgi:hypothetical protein
MGRRGRPIDVHRGQVVGPVAAMPDGDMNFGRALSACASSWDWAPQARKRLLQRTTRPAKDYPRRASIC